MRSRKFTARSCTTCRSCLVTRLSALTPRVIRDFVRTRRGNDRPPPLAPPFDRWIAKYARDANPSCELNHPTMRGIEGGREEKEERNIALLGYAPSVQLRSTMMKLRRYLRSGQDTCETNGSIFSNFSDLRANSCYTLRNQTGVESLILYEYTCSSSSSSFESFVKQQNNFQPSDNRVAPNQ